MTRPVELLSPAGDMEKLRYAVAYGAGAVYLAGKQYGLRAAAGNFDRDELALATRYCHERGVRVFVTVNTLPRGPELDALPEYLEYLQAIGVDAVIAADLGVMALAGRYAPRVALHVSTQASVVNPGAANAYHSLGARRVVLARELTLEEIADIRAKTPPELELEAFAHGAMCMAYSGRCLLSAYLAGRDANRGACAQPCRWQYRVVEEKRPGQYMPIEEDEQGTYIFNARDLNMLAHLPRLIAAGVGSLKIEGRAKTFYYTAVVTNAYRRALDFYGRTPGGPVPQDLLDELEKVSHREYSAGFYLGDRDGAARADSRYLRPWEVCAVVESCDAGGRAVLRQKNRFEVGRPLELLSPGRDALAFSLDKMESPEGEPLTCAPHPHMLICAQLPYAAPPLSILRRPSEE